MNKKNSILKEKIEENSVLFVACYRGRLILQNGRETYRTEETIRRTCEHYGIKANSFATLNTIITSIDSFDGKRYSKVDRIDSRTLNLDKVDRLNHIARNLDEYKISEVKEKIMEIEAENKMDFKKKVLGNVLVGSAFAILFRGGIRDSIVALISTFVLACTDELIKDLKLNNFFVNFIGGVIAAIISLTFFKFNFIEDISISIISALMLLVPGISFTNSIRDIIAGDFVSGISRGVEAVTTGIALASGSGMILSIFL